MALTNVRLLNGVDLTKELINTFSFSSRSAQETFFLGKTKYNYGNLSYQRKEMTARIKRNIEQLFDVSYMMFKNEDFSNPAKWFYAFITDMKFINREVTEVSFEIDPWQTWYFDIRYGQSFIERKHVENDTVGNHVVNENLDVGELIPEAPTFVNLGENLAIVAWMEGNGVGTPTTLIDGVPQGCKFTWFKLTPAGRTLLNAFIDGFGSDRDRVVSITLAPASLLGNPVADSALIQDGFTSTTSLYDYFYVTNPTFGGYTPKNNKLKTYPFRYLTVSNYKTEQLFRFENINGSPFSFNIEGNISNLPSIMMTPINYNFVVPQQDLGLLIDDYPQGSWQFGTFSEYLSQNKVANSLSLVGGATALVAGIVTGNPVSAVGGALAVGNVIGNFDKASIEGNKVRGNLQGSLRIATDTQKFVIKEFRIKAETARIIDDYFTRYGYKVNILETPQLVTRQNFNYIKTIDANIYGDFPNDDIERISTSLNKGITFWHSDNVGDYSLSNNPI